MCSGRTRHTEVVRVVFDPTEVAQRRLLLERHLRLDGPAGRGVALPRSELVATSGPDFCYFK
ncbi:hypothetical protein [Nonomuraea glycinis]|uniref:hypothetical protein n=1 Tax=Nonomuraea glycinis TaxID=2047744 RepID=UPI003558212A